MIDITIGLFGTCGGSKWRDPFIEVYGRASIPFYNPQVIEWKEEDAIIEAEHLANDEVVLFPITGETYGLGSLAETGFSILQAIKLEENRDFVLLIDKTPNKELKDDEALYRESCRARALVIQHLKKLNLSNVYLVETLDEMLEVSLTLFQLSSTRSTLRKYSLSKP